jgi:hypothetical protein
LNAAPSPEAALTAADCVPHVRLRVRVDMRSVIGFPILCLDEAIDLSLVSA